MFARIMAIKYSLSLCVNGNCDVCCIFAPCRHAEGYRGRRQNLLRENDKGMKTDVEDLHVCEVTCINCKKSSK